MENANQGNGRYRAPTTSGSARSDPLSHASLASTLSTPESSSSSDQLLRYRLFTSFSQGHRLMSDDYFRQLRLEDQKNVDEFICGWGAAFINICITFPINKIMFRQMAYGLNASSAMNQLKGQSFFYIYRGILPPLISKTIAVSVMFGTYHEYQRLLFYHAHLDHMYTNLTLSAMLAGSTEAILTPFERIQMLLQHKTFDQKFGNSLHAFRSLRKYGVKEYYRGLMPILLRNGPSNVIYFSSRSKAKSMFNRSQHWYVNLAHDFVSGALIGAIISTLFYPLNVVRTKMQTVPLGSEYLSMREALRLVYLERDRSIRKIYYGVHINFTRALLSWGIITASYEFLKKTFFS